MMDYRVYVLIAFLTAAVDGQQRFINAPSDVEVIHGSTVVLPCQVANLVGMVQWTRAEFGLGVDRALPNFPRYSIKGSAREGEYNLMISNARLEDDAVFECQVMATPTTRTLRSNKATVIVLMAADAPVISGGEVVEVVANTPTNITCTAPNGRPAANITWYHQGSPVTHKVYESVAESPTNAKLSDVTSHMTVTADRSHDGDVYECRSWNKAQLNQVKTTIKQIAVLFAPQITLSVTPENILREHTAVRFVCRAEAKPAVITWKWFKGSTLLEGETSHTLYIPSLTRDYHQSEITCEGTNRVGSARQSQSVTVQYGPHFTTEAEHIAVDIGDPAMLQCNVDSNPPPAITWYRKSDVTKRILSSSNQMSISSVREDHVGVYVCHVEVSGFHPIAMDVHLLKKQAPLITSPRDQYGRIGDIGRLVCVSTSVPLPTELTWMTDGQVIRPDKHGHRYHITHVDDSFGRESVLEIAGIREDDFTDYNCTVTNSYGSHNKIITLHRKDIRPLAYILSGVLAGIVIVIIITILIFIYYKRKSSGADSDSDDSGRSITPRKLNDSPLDHLHLPAPTPTSTLQRRRDDHVDLWRRDQQNSLYDHLPQHAPASYYLDSTVANPNYNDNPYGTHPGYDYRPVPPAPHPVAPSLVGAPPPPSLGSQHIYDTYPRLPARNPDIYGSHGDYGHYPTLVPTPAPPPDAYSSLSRSAAPSRLSTNV